ncbi:MAG: hypothetical protein CBE10_00855 [bacterium TMED250]|nr:MAG: hypothetical protein CBE10_00855 [bacterium TMED250]
MTEFYKDLKTIRTEKGIELEKIHERTKISLSALHAIEKGKFDQLPYTYVRLFIRAYAVEIGVDPEDVLNDLDVYLGNKTLPKKKSNKSAVKFKIEEKKSTPDAKIKKNQISKRPSISIRSDIIKSIFVIATLLFALYIILSINRDTEDFNTKTSYESEFEEEGPISDQMLDEGYIKISETKQALKTSAPYSINLTTDQRLWYEIKTDDLLSSEQVLPAGDNHLHRFNSAINIKFNQTLGLNLNLNGSTISILKSDIYPIRVLISVPKKTVIVQKFSPKK